MEIYKDIVRKEWTRNFKRLCLIDKSNPFFVLSVDLWRSRSLFTQAFLLFLRFCHGGWSSCMFSVLSAVLSLQLCLFYPSQGTPLSFPHVHHKKEDTPPPPHLPLPNTSRTRGSWHCGCCTTFLRHDITNTDSLGGRRAIAAWWPGYTPPTLPHPVTTRSLFCSQHTPSLSWWGGVWSGLCLWSDLWRCVSVCLNGEATGTWLNVTRGLSRIGKCRALSSPNVGGSSHLSYRHSNGIRSLTFTDLFINIWGSCWGLNADIRGKRVEVLKWILGAWWLSAPVCSSFHTGHLGVLGRMHKAEGTEGSIKPLTLCLIANCHRERTQAAKMKTFWWK